MANEVIWYDVEETTEIIIIEMQGNNNEIIDYSDLDNFKI